MVTFQDIEAFIKQISCDLADGFVPMILLASAGSYAIGQCDDLNQLNQITYNYKMWLHLEGLYLSTLALYSVPTEIQVICFFLKNNIFIGNIKRIYNFRYSKASEFW